MEQPKLTTRTNDVNTSNNLHIPKNNRKNQRNNNNKRKQKQTTKTNTKLHNQIKRGKTKMNEKQHEEYLQRVEEAINEVLQNQQEQQDIQAIETLTQFYQTEIQDEKGELHHLKTDEKVTKLFQEITQELDEEYRNEPYEE